MTAPLTLLSVLLSAPLPSLAAAGAAAPTPAASASTPEAPDPKTPRVLPSFGARTTRQDVERPPGLPEDAALQAAGARIGEIRITPREIFDLSRPEENTALFRLANLLHIGTRPDTIASQLLFGSGDPYDPRRLRETERVLRDTRYLNDAWIRPVAVRDGVVDVEVITKDVWTLNPGISFGRKGGHNTSGFEIEELNLLGRGSQLSLGRRSGIDRSSTSLIYRDRQLGHSWWSVDLLYSDNSDGVEKALALDHDFHELDARWAAGGAWSDDDRIDSRYDLGEEVGEYRRIARGATAYGGWSRGLVGGHVLRWRYGATLDERRFAAVPGTPLPTPTPPGRKLAYPWVSAEWVQDDFRADRNRDQIERTEDLQYGWRLRGRLGWADPAFGADRSAALFEASASRGYELSRDAALLLSGSLTGRFEDGSFADTIIGGSARWYRRQSPRRLLFASLSLEAGTNLDADRQILIGGDSGLRGYPLRYQAGEGRWLATLEQRAFTNWFPFRLFNVGAAAFVDVGGAWGDNPWGSRSRGTLADVGIGLRLGNNRSALGNVLHIDLAFPLNGDSSIDGVQLLVETRRSF